MKRVLCIIFSLFIVIGCFSGCSEKVPAGDSVDESVNVDIKDNVTTTEKGNEGVFGIGFDTEVYRVPMTDIYIDLPSAPYHLVEMGFTKAAFIYDEQCISMTDNSGVTSTNLKEVNQSNIEKFSQNMSNQFKVEKLNVVNEETVTINGTEMYRFEGELVCYYETIINGQTNKTTYTQYCVGYTFIRDDMPCSLIGTVLNKNNEQPESVEKDVEEKVDILIKTLRSEP